MVYVLLRIYSPCDPLGIAFLYKSCFITSITGHFLYKIRAYNVEKDRRILKKRYKQKSTDK